MRVSSLALVVEALAAKSWIVGRVTKMSGRTAMVKTMVNRFRR